MRKASKKLTAFFTTLVILVVLYILTLFVAPSAIENGLGATMILSIVANGATLIGGNAYDKRTISQYYNENLAEPPAQG